MNWKLIATAASGILLLGSLVIVSFLISETTLAKAVNVSILVFGTSIGWAIGIVVSPYSKAELDRFTTMSKAVAAFGSGYLVGKVDRLVEQLFDPALAFETVHGFRLLAGFSAFALAVVITFVFRQYSRGEKAERAT